MKMKKVFIPPVVLQTVAVRLEEDFLQGPSNVGQVESTGQELEHYNTNTSTATHGEWSID